jgi:hypothetical protein
MHSTWEALAGRNSCNARGAAHLVNLLAPPKPQTQEYSWAVSTYGCVLPSKFYSPFLQHLFLGKESFIVLPANKTCASLVLLAWVSPQPPFVNGDHLSHNIRGNSDHLVRRYKLLVGGGGGNPLFLAQQARPSRTVRSVGVEPNNFFSKTFGNRTLQPQIKGNMLNHKAIPLVSYLPYASV